MRRLLPFALAALLALALLPGIAAVGALDWREARDIATARETLARRTVTAVLEGEPALERPLPGLAPELGARALANVLPRALPPDRREVVASRLVRAALAAALALLVAAIGTRAFGWRAGALAACALASSVGLPLTARCDGVQIVATLPAWFAIGQWLDALRARPRPRDRSLVLGWSGIGVAALTGGPLSALWPVAGLALYFALARRRDDWHALRPLAGLALAFGVALPWYGVATVVHGVPFLAAVPWLPYARFDAGAWPAGPLLALSAVLVASFPWTPLLGAALADAGARLRRARAGAPGGVTDPDHAAHLLLALIAAATLPVMIERQPPLTAALPALPAIALLVGRFVDRVLDGDADPRLLATATQALAVLGTAFALGVVLLSGRLADAYAPLRALAAVVFLASWAPLLAGLRRAPKFAAALFALPVALGAPLAFARVVPALEPWLSARPVADVMLHVAPPRAPLVVVEPPPPSLSATLWRNLVLRRDPRELSDVAARDGFAYLAFRPARETDVAAAVRRPLHVLARTPTLVLARVSTH